MNGGSGGIVVLPGHGGGVSGSSVTGKPTKPTFQDIISGSERALLGALIADFLKQNPSVVPAADPAVINAAVVDYLNANTIVSGLDQSAVQALITSALNGIRQGHTDDQIRTIVDGFISSQPQSLADAVAAYITAHPVQPGHTDAQINNLVKNYLIANPVTVPTAQITAAVTAYLQANPPSGAQPADIQAAVNTYLTAHPPTNGVTQQQMADALTALLSDTRFNTAVNALVDTKQTTLLTTTAFKNAVNALINTAIAAYNFDSILAAYLTAHPQGQSATQVQNAISQYLQANPQGLSQAQVQSIVASYLQANPPANNVSQADIERAVNTYLAANPPTSYRRFSSWAALSAAAPTATGERVYLDDYTNKSGWAAMVLNGGGWFIGNKVAAAAWKTPDKGIFAGDATATDKTFYWKRDLPLDELTIMHFGAIGDGVTDDGPACMAMYDALRSSQTLALNSKADMMPIKFPAGKFMVKPLDFTKKGTVTSAADLKIARQKVIWRENGLQRNSLAGSGIGVAANGGDAAGYTNIDVDWVKANKPALYLDYSAQENHNGYNAISYFGLTGPKVQYGRGVQTTIVSDGTMDSYVFEVRSIRTEMHGIQFEGGAGTENEVKVWGTNGAKPGVTAKNNQGFFKNWRSEGQYYDVSCMRMLMVGGRCFDMVDTLDAKFDQIYSSLCWGVVIYSGWSNAVNGAWDHGTALEICNSHFENHLTIEVPMYLPRCAQSLVRNVWVEKCLSPAVFENGELTLDTFCVEDCDYPVYALYARDTMTVYSAPTGVQYDTTTRPYLVQPALNDAIGTWQKNPLWGAPNTTADKAVYAKYNSLYTRPNGSPIIEWLPAYERGHLRLENYGIQADGPITSGNFMSGTISNPYPEERWVCVGMNELWGETDGAEARLRAQYAKAGKTAAEITAAVTALQLGSGIEIQIFNSRPNDTNGNSNVLLNTQPGKTVIRRKRPANRNPTAEVSFFNEGDTVIQAVGVSGWGNTKFWVKLPASSGEYGFIVTGGGSTRFNRGAHTRWEDGAGETVGVAAGGGFLLDATSGKPISDKGATLNDSGMCVKSWSVNVGTGGIAITNSGMIGLKTVAPSKIPTTFTLADVGAWVAVNVDGVNLVLPALKIPT
jgi:hypothetical protein